MARGNAINTFKRDTLLLEFIRNHKGKENIVSAKEICDFLNESGYSTKIGVVNSLIKKIMYERNAPICYYNAKGYYWGKTKSEIKETIADLEMRRASLQEHIDHLKNFIIE